VQGAGSGTSIRRYPRPTGLNKPFFRNHLAAHGWASGSIG
jgi:hypothetical protein